MSDTIPFEHTLTIFDLLKVRAEEAPEGIAITAPGRLPLRNRRLLSQVEEVVATLNRIGFGRNDHLAIACPNGPEMAVAFLAVTAGAISAPLNPVLRMNEYDVCLADLRAQALIVQAGVDTPAVGAAKARGIPVINLLPRLEAEAGIFALNGDPIARSTRAGFATAEEVALLLQTSGTTSRPKIVPLTQTNICTSAHNIRRSLELSKSDRCLNVMPLFHIHGLIGALLSSLAAGGSIICTPGFYAPSFFEWLDELQPTWYTAVPTIHQAVLARAATTPEARTRCRLRFVRSCSAPLPPRVMAELEDVLRAPVIEAYGMTEAAHQIACNPLPPRPRKPGSVGLPTGVELAILDSDGNVLPVGQTGEVVIRGTTVTSGYDGGVGTEQSHIRGWLRTGDLGYLDADGYLFLTGRLKEMINRGGTKIAPREVEEVLLTIPAVAQAVAFAVPHRTLGEEVAAAVVLREGAHIEEREIRECAAQRLADFKVPRLVLILDEIPKGPTGKFQRVGLAERLGLKARVEESAQARAVYVAPRSPLERTVAEMWTQVFGCQSIGVHDDFFQLGGDSMLGTRLFSLVRQTLQTQISLIRFFEIPTVEGQALAIAEGQPGAATPSIVAIQPTGRRPPFYYVPAGRDLMGLLDLGRLLGPDQPFYALHPDELVREQGRYVVEEAAARYLREIRSIQPQGPYFIGAACSGSVVAVELARALLAQGQKVGLLALIIPMVHEYKRYVHHTLGSYWQSLSPLPPQEKLSRILGTLGRLTQTTRQRLRNKIAGNPMISHRLGRPHSEPVAIDVMATNRRSLRASVHNTYPGHMTILVTKDMFSESQLFLDPGVVWSRVAQGGLEVHVVPGSHSTILSHPYVEVVAETLRACLDKAMTEDSSTQAPPRGA